MLCAEKWRKAIVVSMARKRGDVLEPEKEDRRATEVLEDRDTTGRTSRARTSLRSHESFAWKGTFHPAVRASNMQLPGTGEDSSRGSTKESSGMSSSNSSRPGSKEKPRGFRFPSANAALKSKMKALSVFSGRTSTTRGATTENVDENESASAREEDIMPPGGATSSESVRDATEATVFPHSTTSGPDDLFGAELVVAFFADDGVSVTDEKETLAPGSVILPLEVANAPLDWRAPRDRVAPGRRIMSGGGGADSLAASTVMEDTMSRLGDTWAGADDVDLDSQMDSQLDDGSPLHLWTTRLAERSAAGAGAGVQQVAGNASSGVDSGTVSGTASSCVSEGVGAGNEAAIAVVSAGDDASEQGNEGNEPGRESVGSSPVSVGRRDDVEMNAKEVEQGKQD